MHGLVRCIIRAKGPKRAIEILERWGIKLIERDFGRTWFLSKSVVEQHATHGHSHEPMVCALPCCYLRAEFYEPLRKQPKRAAVDPGVLVRPAGRSRGAVDESEFFGLDREKLRAEFPGRRR